MLELRETCGDRLCIDMGLDRQQLPFWTPAQADDHIRRVVEALGNPKGGLWLKAELGPDIPIDNMDATLRAMERHRRFV
jgi:hypothetical protein